MPIGHQWRTTRREPIRQRERRKLKSWRREKRKMSDRYSEDEDAMLRDGWLSGLTCMAIAEGLLKRLGAVRTSSSVTGRISRIGLHGRIKPSPTKDAWKAAVIQAAEKHDVPVGYILGGDRSAKTVAARWEAWSYLWGDGKRYSLSSLGRRVGVDHSSIYHALKHNFCKPPSRTNSERGRHPNTIATLIGFSAQRRQKKLAEDASGYSSRP